jgi:5-(carboxyamino)imidazole ribonucleotide synthase
VYQFGKGLDVLTIEIEKVNTQALEVLEREGVRVHPSPAAIALIQDKRRQKEFYREHHIPTAPFVLTDDRQHALQLASDWLPAFHKLGRDGYDGKGVVYLPDASGLDHLFDAPGVLERAIPVHQELSVIVARGGDGSMRSFPAVEMVFNPAYHLLDYLLAPARIGVGQAMEAQLLAERLADTLGIVGLLAVEMFVTPEGRLLVNEVAPRPHNSGHHTIRANCTSQYEQHLRAILGLPLGSPEATVPAAAIVNLIGAIGHSGPVCYTGLSQVLATEGCYIHL